MTTLEFAEKNLSSAKEDLVNAMVKKNVAKSEIESLTDKVIYWKDIVRMLRKKYENAEHCICCGEVITEGRQVCPHCEEIIVKEVCKK